MPQTPRFALLAVILRDIGRIAASPLLLMLMVVLPLLSAG